MSKTVCHSTTMSSEDAELKAKELNKAMKKNGIDN